MLYQALAEMCQQMGKNEDELMSVFIQALPPHPYQTTIMAANLKTLTETLQIAKGVEAMNLQPEGHRRRQHTDMYTMMSEMNLTDDMEHHKEEMRAQLDARATKMAAMESKLNKAFSNRETTDSSGNQGSDAISGNAQSGECDQGRCHRAASLDKNGIHFALLISFRVFSDFAEKIK